MLGYSGGVSLNYSPRTQPIRTLLPGREISIAPDNQGGTSANETLSQKPDITDGGEEDIRGFIFNTSRPLFGFDYARMAENSKGSENVARDFRETRQSPMAQAAKLLKNVHFNLQGLTRRIVSPDIQSQFETGYTLPLQEFAFISDKIWNSPSGRNVAGSTLASQQPTLQQPAPTASIPTKMPWNISAPGQTY